jgi:hypothetical protein
VTPGGNSIRFGPWLLRLAPGRAGGVPAASVHLGYSEDLNHGQVFDGVKVFNPFL